VSDIAQIGKTSIKDLAKRAWLARDNAYILGNTKVGCALLSADGSIFTGCNVEHRFRSHDVHAEVNAISSMVLSGQRAILVLVVVAERERFTPCGACMDWIMQFCDAEECVIGFQSSRGGAITTYKASQLMPFYPT